MLPYECNAIAFAGHHKVVAHALGVSATLVDKYCQPPKSHGGEGENSPTQRFIEQTKALRSAAAPGAEMPIEYVNAELGYLPPIRADVASRQFSLVDIAQATHTFAEFLTCASDDLKDSVLTHDEMKDLSRHLWAHVGVMVGQFRALQSALNDHEVSEVRLRLGPKRALPKYLQLRRETA